VIEQVTNAPIAGVRVVLSSGGNRPRQTLTDPEGRYAFEELEAGPYQIAVDKVGYVKPDRASLPTFMLAAGQTLHVSPVMLDRTGVIAGRILDPRGNPLQDVSVRAIRRGATTMIDRSPVADRLLQRDRTDDLGEFRIFGLMPGDYMVVASPQPFGLATGAVSTPMFPETYYPGTPDAAAAQVLTVTAGQTVRIDFLLVAAPTFRVSGLVVDETGAAVAGATVTIAIDARAHGGAVGRVANAETDASGRFTIGNVTSGAYYATAFAVSRATGRGGVERDTVVSGGPNPTRRSDPVQVLVNDADVEGVTIVVPRR
jgi:protocatechuate 3,4-dioxygenase beta subunit